MFSWRFLVVSVKCPRQVRTSVRSCGALELHLLTALNAAQCRQVVKKADLEQRGNNPQPLKIQELLKKFIITSLVTHQAFQGWTVLLRTGPHLMGSQFFPHATLRLEKRNWKQIWKKGRFFPLKYQIQSSRQDYCHDTLGFSLDDWKWCEENTALEPTQCLVKVRV